MVLDITIPNLIFNLCEHGNMFGINIFSFFRSYLIIKTSNRFCLNEYWDKFQSVPITS